MINVINISPLMLKKKLIESINFNYRTTIEPILEKLDLKRTTIEGSFLLTDINNNRGVLFNKIDVTLLFPLPFDITFIKEQQSRPGQLPKDYTQEMVDEMNEGFRSQIVEIASDGFQVPYNTDEVLAKFFLLFIKITGMKGLSLDEVELYQNENIMTVSVLDSHPCLKGEIKVKIYN